MLLFLVAELQKKYKYTSEIFLKDLDFTLFLFRYTSGIFLLNFMKIYRTNKHVLLLVCQAFIHMFLVFCHVLLFLTKINFMYYHGTLK